MSPLFPRLQRDLVIRLLHGQTLMDVGETTLRFTADQLVQLGILTIARSTYVRCVCEADDDYPDEIIDPSCSGIVQISRSGRPTEQPFICPLCQRAISYPAKNKTLFQYWVAERNEAGIVAYIASVLGTPSSVSAVRPSRGGDLEITLGNSRNLRAAIVPRPTEARTQHRSADMGTRIQVITQPTEEDLAQSFARSSQDIHLHDLLTQDRNWLERWFDQIIHTSFLIQQDREDLQELSLALLDAFPNKHHLSRMVRFQLNKQLDTIAPGRSLEEVIFNLIIVAETEGWLPDLVEAAKKENPNNELLQSLNW